MIAIITITLVLSISIITALVGKFNTITKLEKKVDGLENEFRKSYQSYNEFQTIYRELGERYRSADILYTQCYKDIKETYTRLINLLQEYTKCLPENIRAELNKIEDKQIKLIQLQNQILDDIENNPNYDDETKQKLKEHVLKSI